MILDVKTGETPKVFEHRSSYTFEFKVEAKVSRSGRIIKDCITRVDTDTGYIKTVSPDDFNSDDWDRRYINADDFGTEFDCEYIKVFYYKYNDENQPDLGGEWTEVIEKNT